MQNKLPFFVIIGLAVLIVAGMGLVYLVWPKSATPLAPLQPEPVAVKIIVAPGLKPWADEAAQRFNAAHPATQISLEAAAQLSPTSQFQPLAGQTAPAAWLAEANFVVDMAARDGYRFDDRQAVASSVLAWGGYSDKIEQFRQDFGELTWDNIHAKAAGRDGFRLVIASPKNSAEGVAALASADAAHLAKESLTAADIGRADAWLTETLGNRNAQPIAKPAETLASVQGRSIAEAGLLTKASWQSAGLPQKTGFVILPLTPPISLDYPLAIRNGASPQEQKAVQSFREFLLQPEQQQALAAFGLSPAAASAAGIKLDGEAASRLISWPSGPFASSFL
jgi:ABC-type molybdate transport system substrate-binding protein